MSIYGTYAETGVIIRASDGASIPPDPANRDYQEALAAVAAGDTIEPYVAPTPSTNPADYDLSKRQICAALIVSGKTTDPDGFMTGIIGNISDATTRALALNDWRNAPFYVRSNSLFNDAGLLVAAGMTSAQIDTVWLLAKDQPR